MENEFKKIWDLICPKIQDNLEFKVIIVSTPTGETLFEKDFVYDKNAFISTEEKNYIQKTQEAFLKPKEVDADVVFESDISNLPKVIKINDVLLTMNFGKYYGYTIQHILSVEASYIIWLHTNHIRGIFVSNEIMKEAYDLRDIQAKKHFADKQYNERHTYGKVDNIDDSFDYKQDDDLPF